MYVIRYNSLFLNCTNQRIVPQSFCFVHCKKGSEFPVLCRDVTNQTLPWQGIIKSLTIFTRIFVLFTILVDYSLFRQVTTPALITHLILFINSRDCITRKRTEIIFIWFFNCPFRIQVQVKVHQLYLRIPLPTYDGKSPIYLETCSR